MTTPTWSGALEKSKNEREKSWTLDHRWWSADEISASAERFEPKNVAAYLKALLRDGPPAEPLTIA